MSLFCTDLAILQSLNDDESTLARSEKQESHTQVVLRHKNGNSCEANQLLLDLSEKKHLVNNNS